MWRWWNHWRFLDDVYQHRGKISTQFQKKLLKNRWFISYRFFRNFESWQVDIGNSPWWSIHLLGYLIKFLRPEEMDEEELQRLGFTFFFRIRGRWERCIFFLVFVLRMEGCRFCRNLYTLFFPKSNFCTETLDTPGPTWMANLWSCDRLKKDLQRFILQHKVGEGLISPWFKACKASKAWWFGFIQHEEHESLLTSYLFFEVRKFFELRSCVTGNAADKCGQTYHVVWNSLWSINM